MRPDHPTKDKMLANFLNARIEYQKWDSMFRCTGLKPNRFLIDADAVYLGTSEGWYRLGFNKYTRRELRWVRQMLEYLEERSFKNWVVPWQKTIIWEENNSCYLVQPWVMTGEPFQTSDPSSVQRVAEIMANFYSCGKDFVESKGMEIVRDQWSNIEVEWENGLRNLDRLKVEDYPDKSHGDLQELRKIVSTLLKENLNNWRVSGINSLLEHQRRTGVLGHGRLLAKNIISINNDYYLLNWENIAFQPRIMDLAVLINDVAFWEPEWILYLINEYSRLQPFWPEEYVALQALLQSPLGALDILVKGPGHELDRKVVKEATKELARKERCLGKVWRELGTERRWAGNSFNNNNSPLSLNKLSMVLAPVETWGDFQSMKDSLITVKNEPKLPVDVIERLNSFDPDRIIGGKDGNILKGSAALPEVPAANEPEIEMPVAENSQEHIDSLEQPPEAQPQASEPASAPETYKPAIKKEVERVIRWGNFPRNSA